MITIEFVQGIPVGINGEKVNSLELVMRLNRLGGENGIGRIDIVENRLVGMKSRGVYETPGGTILYAAHRELESLVLAADILRYKDELASKYAALIYNGQWYTPLRQSMEAFIEKTQEKITGTVRLKLYKGNCIIEGRKSPYSLYREDLATFGEDDIYEQKDAEGFINLFGLPSKVKAMIELEGDVPPHYEHPDYSKFKRD